MYISIFKYIFFLKVKIIPHLYAVLACYNVLVIVFTEVKLTQNRYFVKKKNGILWLKYVYFSNIIF